MNSIIQTPTNNLKASIDFYKKLNFKTFTLEERNFATDGKVLIEINKERFARAGVKMYRESWKSIVTKVEKLTKVHTIDGGFLFSDPCNVWIYLMEAENKIVDWQSDDSSTLGNYMGLSLETTDIHRSMELWSILGLEKKMGGLEQGWVVFGNDNGLAVSFMQPNSCPHLFFNPSFTFFNGKENLDIIENIRKIGIPFTEEITHFNKEGIVDNVILRDPGGFGFFIFSD